MSLGLPEHLASHRISRALASSSHVLALVSLLVALVSVVTLQVTYPTAIMWPAMVAILPTLVALWLLDHNRSMFFTVTYLLVGSVCLYWFSIVEINVFSIPVYTDNFVLTSMKIALIAVGGVGIGLRSIIAWSVVGYLVAETAVVTAAVQSGSPVVVDTAAIAVLVLLTVVHSLILRSRRTPGVAQPSLYRAARDEQLSDLRHRMEVKASAFLHDTILSDLAAVASAPDGPMAPALQKQITRDFEVLVGEEWLVDVGNPDSDAEDGWRSSPLLVSINEARGRGLEVELSGEVAALNRLGPARATAVGQAAMQCLINVIAHSGATRAEVVVFGADDEVSVMVVDGGAGFSEAEIATDRLGLRQSVRSRIALVGGTVRIWSSPGKGTSVMIRVPAGPGPSLALDGGFRDSAAVTAVPDEAGALG